MSEIPPRELSIEVLKAYYPKRDPYAKDKFEISTSDVILFTPVELPERSMNSCLFYLTAN